ncbi:MAG: FHA domain-containing protein [Cyanobacteriota bacterium]|nr:FHA domain-containing protein [Cyanobacteriota bacterium]
MSQAAQLVLRNDPSKVSTLNPSTPTTIGRADGNRLRLVSLEGVADHHAVVRFSRSQGWLVCDWQSSDGTYLEGERIRHCRQLSDGDEIQLGQQGPVLVFRLQGTAPAPTPAPASAPAPQRPAARARAAAPLTLGGQAVPLDKVHSVHVRSRPTYPHSFSWWVLVCLGGMVLLPWPWLFWCVQVGALAAWIVLGARKEHELVLTLRDGMAYRHGFANRITALSHRNGIRKAIGQGLGSG